MQVSLDPPAPQGGGSKFMVDIYCLFLAAFDGHLLVGAAAAEVGVGLERD